MSFSNKINISKKESREGGFAPSLELTPN